MGDKEKLSLKQGTKPIPWSQGGRGGTKMKRCIHCPNSIYIYIYAIYEHEGSSCSVSKVTK
jgi:hypothetical protein